MGPHSGYESCSEGKGKEVMGSYQSPFHPAEESPETLFTTDDHDPRSERWGQSGVFRYLV